MDELHIDGNPAWIDQDAADGNLIVAAITHGGSVGSITFELFSFEGEPRVEVGIELTKDDCRRIAEFLVKL